MRVGVGAGVGVGKPRVVSKSSVRTARVRVASSSRSLAACQACFSLLAPTARVVVGRGHTPELCMRPLHVHSPCVRPLLGGFRDRSRDRSPRRCLAPWVRSRAARRRLGVAATVAAAAGVTISAGWPTRQPSRIARQRRPSGPRALVRASAARAPELGWWGGAARWRPRCRGDGARRCSGRWSSTSRSRCARSLRRGARCGVRTAGCLARDDMQHAITAAWGWGSGETTLFLTRMRSPIPTPLQIDKLEYRRLLDDPSALLAQKPRRRAGLRSRKASLHA